MLHTTRAVQVRKTVPGGECYYRGVDVSSPPSRARSRSRKRAVPFVVGLMAALMGIAVAIAPPSPANADSQEHVLSFGSDWEFYRSNTAPPADWRTVTGGWSSGTAPFGYGVRTGEVQTPLPSTADRRPLATFFRTTVALPRGAISATITTWADDGVVVYINGREVGRSNVQRAASVPVTPTSYARTAPSSAAARANPVTFQIGEGLLTAGENVIAVQVLSNWRNTHNITFDLELRAVLERSVDPGPDPDPGPGEPTDPGAVIDGWGAPVWADEFDYVDPDTGEEVVDPAKWNVRSRPNLGLLFDAAVVDDRQVTVQDGIMTIRADWFDQPVIRPVSQQLGTLPNELWHRTGYLDHRGLDPGDVTFAQRYGRWEIRAKTPSGPNTLGSLAAFWLRNEQSGEIDIMEAWGYADGADRDQRIDTATTTVHTHTSNPSLNSKYIWHHSEHGAQTPVWDRFVTYAFELTPDYAAIIVDGEEIARATPTSHPNLWDERYFGSPLHVRLNLHVGPSERYWGLPDPSARQLTQNLDFEVDYVRIWSYE